MAVVPEIGLLGGSFDPVHRAHVALAQAAREALALARVELLPAARPWQRGALRATAHDRVHMLRLACEDHPYLRVNTAELERPGATYTIDTLLALPREARYTWILGADQLENFCTWHRWREILERVRLAVARRPGTTLTPPAELADALGADGLYVIPFAAQDISSTDIRTRLATGLPVDDMLDPRVLSYIRARRLYQQGAPSTDRPHTS